MILNYLVLSSTRHYPFFPHVGLVLSVKKVSHLTGFCIRIISRHMELSALLHLLIKHVKSTNSPSSHILCSCLEAVPNWYLIGWIKVRGKFPKKKKVSF